MIGRFDEQLHGEPLLQPMMRWGVSVTRIELEESRRHFQRELARLPDQLRTLEPSPSAYPVSFSECIRRDLDTIRAELARGT